MAKNRDIAYELSQGLQEIQDHYNKKLILKEINILPKKQQIAPNEIRYIRESLNISQGVFALYLNTGLTTYRNWEQGIAKPNGQVIILLKMLHTNPEMLSILKKMIVK